MRTYITSCLLVLGMVAGCSTPPRSSGGDNSREARAVAAAAARQYTPEQIERRTEAQARYAAGYLHDLNERPAAAAEEYVRAALADPADEGMVLEVVGRLFRFKQTGKALEVLQRAAAEPEASGLLYAHLGLAYALADQKQAAIEANRTAIAKAPGLLAGYRHLAQIYFQDNRAEEGLAVLEQAARQPGADAQFLSELGEFYLAFAQTGVQEAAKMRAREVFTRAAQLEPAHPVVLQKLADGFVFLGETETAAGLYQKLLEQFPQLPGIREKLADLYLRNKDYGQAAEQLRSIVGNNPTDPRAHYLLGSIAYEARDMATAAECFDKVKLLNPRFEPAYYDLAGALITLDQAGRAVEVLQEARSKFDRNFVCEFYLGLAYGRLKDPRAAVRHLVEAEVVARATDTNRLNHVFYFQLGAAYERNEQHAEATESFRQCLELKPDFGEALNYLGYMWADRGENLDEARGLIEQAVEQEPENAAFLDSLGWVLFRLNQPAAALPHLLKAIEQSETPDPTLHDHLGDVYLALEQPQQARAAWEEALRLESESDSDLDEGAVRKKLESLPRGPEATAGTSSP